MDRRHSHWCLHLTPYIIFHTSNASFMISGTKSFFHKIRQSFMIIEVLARYMILSIAISKSGKKDFPRTRYFWAIYVFYTASDYLRLRPSARQLDLQISFGAERLRLDHTQPSILNLWLLVNTRPRWPIIFRRMVLLITLTHVNIVCHYVLNPVTDLANISTRGKMEECYHRVEVHSSSKLLTVVAQ